VADHRRLARRLGLNDRIQLIGPASPFGNSRGTFRKQRDRWFESGSLQRRVCLSPESAFGGREPRLSARVCAAGLATGSAETRRVCRYRGKRRQYLCRAIFQYRSAADGVGGNATLIPTKIGVPHRPTQRAGDRERGQEGHQISGLRTNSLPIPNREFFGALQGIKSGDQGNFRPDQGNPALAAKMLAFASPTNPIVPTDLEHLATVRIPLGCLPPVRNRLPTCPRRRQGRSRGSRRCAVRT
jgi:hypothetical protein